MPIGKIGTRRHTNITKVKRHKKKPKTMDISQIQSLQGTIHGWTKLVLKTSEYMENRYGTKYQDNRV